MSRNPQEMPPDDFLDTELTIMVTIGEMNIRATVNTGWRTSGISKDTWKKVKTPLVPYPEEKGSLTALDGTVLNPIGLTSFQVHFPSSAGWVNDAIVYEGGKPCMLGLDVVTAVGLSINTRRGEYYVDPPSSNQRAAYMEMLKRPLVCIGVKGNNSGGGSTGGLKDEAEPPENPHRNSKHDNNNGNFRTVNKDTGNYRGPIPQASGPSEGHVRSGMQARRCYTCGEWGHVSNECPAGPNRCHLCHRRGHQKKDCPGISPPKVDHRSSSPRNRYKELRHI